MRKFLFTLALCLLFVGCFAQSESAVSKAVFEKFKTHYNNNQPDSIYAMFSPEAKVRMPMEKTAAFLGRLYNSHGKIKTALFTGIEGGFAVYITALERGYVILQLAIDNNNAITGLFAKPYQPTTVAPGKANVTALKLPFKGEWTIFWGGDTKEQNQHIGVAFQRNAFDIIITDRNRRSFRTDGKRNEDYYAFNKPITAPCDGEVVLAVDGVTDNIPGVVNTLYIPGNTVILRTKNNEYIFLAHFKQQSVKVRRGDKVKSGQLLGLCGNSGNSSEPHLHFHIQDNEDPLQATGIKCNFDQINVSGKVRTGYSPVKGDKVSNIQ